MIVTDTPTLSPVAETLALLATRSPYMTVQSETDEGQWLTARQFLNAPVFLSACLDKVAAGYNNRDLKIAGSFFLLRYTWMVGVGVIGCYLAANRVPSLTLDNVALRFGEDGYPSAVAFLNPCCAVLPDDPRAYEPGCRIVPSLSALQDAVRTSLESYCAALITAMRPHTPLNARTLWGLATDRHAQICLLGCELLGDPTRGEREVTALTNSKPSLFSPRTSSIEVDFGDHSHWMVNASACCLSYKLPGNHYCNTCPLLSMEERIARFHADHAS
jgi:ferric iron reductase protein FhuF